MVVGVGDKDAFDDLDAVWLRVTCLTHHASPSPGFFASNHDAGSLLPAFRWILFDKNIKEPASADIWTASCMCCSNLRHDMS